MKKQNKVAAWVVVTVVALVAGYAALQAYGQVSILRKEGIDACHAHVELTSGTTVDPSDIKLTSLKTVFPKPMDKRFRAQCEYKGTSIVIETRPLGEWAVID